METITITDRRTINIGNYESRAISISYATDIKQINNQTSVVKIDDSESVSITEKDFTKAVRKAFERVEGRLDKKEARIRQEAIGNDWVDFDEADEKLAAVLKRIKKIKSKK